MILGPLFMIFEVFFDLLQPRLAAYIVDFGVVERNFNVIEQTGLTMAGVAILSLATGVACNLFASRASQNLGADIREALFTKVQTFSFENMDSFKSGSLITRMTNDVVQVQNLMQIALQGLVRAPSLLIGSVVMALLINLRLGLILLAALIVLAAVLFALIKFSAPLFRSVQARLDAVNTRMQENLAGIRVVKAFVRSDYERQRFGEVNREYTQISVKAARFIAINSPIVTLIMNTCLVVILLYGGNLVWDSALQVGELVAFVNYVVQVLSSLLMVSGLLMNVSQANVSARRIHEVLSEQPTMTSAEAGTGANSEVGAAIGAVVGHGAGVGTVARATVGSGSGASLPARQVSFHNVDFSYSSSAEVKDRILSDICIEARQGETVAIIGSTGAGKSSLVQLIPRLYDASSGSLQIDGRDIREIPLAELRGKIGMVLQEAFLFTGTIRDNIAFGKGDATQEEIEHAAKIAQAHDFISKLPDGYYTKLGQRGVNLSGGQKQRISIARALLVKPPILIMDDSTSALDLETERRLRLALKAAMQGSITFLIAQRISSVIDAQRIVVIEDGAVAGNGTHEELMRTCEVYQDIYRSQYGSEEEAYA